MRGEEADFQVAGKHLQANFITIRMRLDFKGDLVFEDLVFEQCERGVDATSYFRGHEVSDQDTKQTFRAVRALKSDRERQDICVYTFLIGLLDVVEDTWNEVPLLCRLSSLDSSTWLRTHGMKYLFSWSPGVVEGYGVMMRRCTRSFTKSSLVISSSLLTMLSSADADRIPFWKSCCSFVVSASQEKVRMMRLVTLLKRT